MKAWRRDRGIKFNAVHCFRYYSQCPPLNVFSLPPHVKITIPPDGGFWLIDTRNGVRYRRITMNDLPRNVTWNTRGKAEREDGD